MIMLIIIRRRSNTSRPSISKYVQYMYIRIA